MSTSAEERLRAAIRPPTLAERADSCLQVLNTLSDEADVLTAAELRDELRWQTMLLAEIRDELRRREAIATEDQLLPGSVRPIPGSHNTLGVVR